MKYLKTFEGSNPELVRKRFVYAPFLDNSEDDIIYELKSRLKYSKVNIDTRNADNDTALIVAAMKMKTSGEPRMKVIKYLIDNGADWTLKNNDNRDFMDYLEPEQKEELKELYPEKWKDYIFHKETEKYNL